MQRTPTLLAKLEIPPPPEPLVARVRLLEKLSPSRPASLTVIRSPAGYGKTVLLAQVCRQRDTSVAWLTLDLKDNDLYRLLAHLIGSFQRAEVLPDELAAHSQSLLPRDPDRAWAHLLNAIQRHREPVLLALDNTHQIKTPGARGLLERLLRQASANLQVMMTTRGAAPVPTAWLRAGGRYVDLDTPDLIFTADEIELLCRSARIDLGARDIHQLGTLTEGWIAGIRLVLAAYNPPGHTRPGVADHPKVTELANRYVAEYFDEEVLSALNAPTLRFLRIMSVVNTFDESLAELLTGQSQATSAIRQLLDRDLFLQPVQRPDGRYRLHPLFQQRLYRQLAEDDPDHVRSLHRKAADWLLGAGHYAEGLCQYGRSHDISSLLAVVEKHTFDLLREGEVNELVASLANISPRLMEEHFTLAITEAAVVHVTRDTHRMKACLNRFQRLLQAPPPHLDTQRLRQTCAYLRAHIAYLGGNLRYGMRLCDRFLDRSADANAPLSVVRFDRANCAYTLGLLPEAYDDARKALSELQRYGLSGYTNCLTFLIGQIEIAQGQPDVAERRYLAMHPEQDRGTAPRNFYDFFYFLGMGLVRFEQNRLKETGAFFNQAAAIALKFQPSAAVPWVLHHLALLHGARNDLEQAANTWDEARTVARQNQLFGIYRLCGAFRVRIALRRPSDDRFIEQWLLEWGTIVRRYGKDTLPEERLAYAWVQFRQGAWDEAFRTCESLISYSQAQRNIALLIDSHLLLGALYQDKAEDEQALQSIDKAVCLSAEHGLSRLFSHEGRDLVDLFKLGLSDKTRQQRGVQHKLSHPELIKELLNSLHPGSRGESTAPELAFDQLTKRELDVLSLVIKGHSNQEIAGTLYVGVSTVKTHINSIFSKLEVSSREEAIRKARCYGSASH